MRFFHLALGLLLSFTIAAATSATTITFKGPLTITKGGTYSGNWESLDSNTPAVSIQTIEPVTLLNCHINATGDGIKSFMVGAQLTVRGCYGVGLDPKIYGKERGMFLRVAEAASVTVEHNDIGGFAFGVNFWGNMGPSRFVFQYNRVHNLDGAESNGRGGRLVDAAHMKYGQDNGNHAVVMDSMQQTTYAQIAWNSFVQAGPFWSIGDIVNIYRSSGTWTAPIEIHDNYFHGGYAARPQMVANCCAPNAVTSEAITADGSSADTSSTTVAHVHIFNNFIVNNGGAQGIGINAGHDNQVFGNRIISTGRLQANGNWFAATYSNPLTVWNKVYYQPSTVYYNNTAHDNLYGWVVMTLNSQGNARAAPAHLVPPNFGGCPASLCYNNHPIAAVSSVLEDAQLTAWRQNLRINKVTVGPTGD